jgi:hypothetical protein
LKKAKESKSLKEIDNRVKEVEAIGDILKKGYYEKKEIDKKYEKLEKK